MPRWGIGQETVDQYIADRTIEFLRGGDADGGHLLQQAHLTLQTAHSAIFTDPRNAVALAYDAIRSASEGLLAHQGLRVRSVSGHHAIVGEIVVAQFGSGFAQFDQWRRRRNELSYASRHNEVATDEADDAVADATDVVNAAQQLLDSGQIGIWA